jgi:hypothetical protein
MKRAPYSAMAKFRRRVGRLGPWSSAGAETAEKQRQTMPDSVTISPNLLRIGFRAFCTSDMKYFAAVELSHTIIKLSLTLPLPVFAGESDYAPVPPS